MSVRNFPAGASNGAVAKNTGLSGASTGNKLQYIVPAGTQSVVRFCSIFPTAGAATIALQCVISGTTVTIMSGTTAQLQNVYVPLNAGDTAKIQVTVLDAASVFDATIGIDEYPST